jgi:hypothetical protein
VEQGEATRFEPIQHGVDDRSARVRNSAVHRDVEPKSTAGHGHVARIHPTCIACGAHRRRNDPDRRLLLGRRLLHRPVRNARHDHDPVHDDDPAQLHDHAADSTGREHIDQHNGRHLG